MSHVTIVEKNPGLLNPTRTDIPIDSIVAALPNAPQRAGFVGELASVMRKHQPPSSPGHTRIFQIIGHGQPGQVSVGFTYEERYQSTHPDRYFCLDSNPFSYSVLDSAVDKDMEVWIIGCSVGETPPESMGFSVNGPTLLFDLAQMWNCTVRASTGLVNEFDFDADGLFKDKSRLVSVEKVTAGTLPAPAGYAWRVSRPPVVARLPAGTPSPHHVELVRMKQAPTVRLSLPIFQPVDLSSVPGTSQDLGNAYSRKLSPGLGPILATPEYVFDARLQGVQGTAEILLNGRLLRFHSANGVEDFVTNPLVEVDPFQSLNKLLQKGLMAL